MYEFLVYMLVPTLISAFLIYVLWIRHLGIGNKITKMSPFILVLTLIMYFVGEAGTCILKPWFFDCSKSIGICPCGLPVEDFLFSFLIILNITMATLAFSEMEKRSKNKKEFLEYFLLLRK